LLDRPEIDIGSKLRGFTPENLSCTAGSPLV
jgi:hypothetical protein